MKICTKCKENKDLSEFYKNENRYRPECKKCSILSASDRQVVKLSNNKEAIYKKAKIKRDNLSEQQKIKNKENNKIKYDNRSDEDKIKENLRRKNRCKIRYETDLNFKLKCILRSRLNTALKKNTKTGSAVDDLGCSIDKFKVYLESKFETWMTWGNHGIYDKSRNTWQLDHIDALANFDLKNKEEFMRAAHYTNYQPLLAKENLEKSNKIIFNRENNKGD